MAPNTRYPKPSLVGDLTIDIIIGSVSHYFRVGAEDIASDKRSAHLINARKAIVYLGQRLLLLSCMKEAAAEGRANLATQRAYTKNITYELAIALNRDHTTIGYYDNCAVDLREKSERFRKLTDIIWDELVDAFELDDDKDIGFLSAKTIKATRTPAIASTR